MQAILPEKASGKSSRRLKGPRLVEGINLNLENARRERSTPLRKNLWASSECSFRWDIISEGNHLTDQKFQNPTKSNSYPQCAEYLPDGCCPNRKWYLLITVLSPVKEGHRPEKNHCRGLLQFSWTEIALCTLKSKPLIFFKTHQKAILINVWQFINQWQKHTTTKSEISLLHPAQGFIPLSIKLLTYNSAS